LVVVITCSATKAFAFFGVIGGFLPSHPVNPVHPVKKNSLVAALLRRVHSSDSWASLSLPNNTEIHRH
jgi:hypothetical protein